MATYYLNNSIYSLLLVMVSLTSCNGQTKTKSQRDMVAQLKTTPAGQLKISKPSGIDQEGNIFCALQDKAGSLWFGTALGDGVYRYDGKSFINFTKKNGLSSNCIVSMLEDKSGNIWFGTDSGLCRYNGKTFTPIPITATNTINYYLFNQPAPNPSTNNGVLSMMQDKSGKIWFGTVDGVYVYNGKSFTHFLDNDGVINKSGLQLKRVSRMLEDKKGNIWFCSGVLAFEGICRYDGKSITNFKPDGEGWIRSIAEDRKGNIWIGTRHKGLWLYDGKSYTHFSKCEKLDSNIVYSVTSVIEDKAGNIWFADENEGVWCYDGKLFAHFTTQNGLCNNRVWCLLEDRDGNIWIGSRGNGLCRYDGKTFTNFTE